MTFPQWSLRMNQIIQDADMTTFNHPPPMVDAKILYDLGASPRAAALAYLGQNRQLFDRALQKAGFYREKR